FPPDRFQGAELSAFSVPALLGTHRTFHLFTTRPQGARLTERAVRVPMEINRDRIDTGIEGPENPFVVGHPALRLPMRIVRDQAAKRVMATVSGTTIQLELGVLSPW